MSQMRRDPLSPGAVADDELVAAGYGVEDTGHGRGRDERGWEYAVIGGERVYTERMRGQRPAATVKGGGDQAAGESENPSWTDRFDFPAPPADAARHGLPGKILAAFGPHTEAGGAAILGQFLAGFGNAVGSRPYFPVGADAHRPNLYVGVVGDSGKGRKGSGLGVALLAVERADPDWARDAKAHGLSTGEGIIHHLRDQKVNRAGDVLDEGAGDKRLLCVETEFARPLRAAAREGSILSMVLRQGWDGQTLQTMTKTNAEKATGALLSMVAHTTRADLRRHLDDVDVLNGFANRFVWLASQRERCLPDGGALDADTVAPLVQQTRKALDAARRVDRMRRDAAAQELWDAVYGPLTEQERTGAFGAITGRADAQLLRLSVVYALTDGSATITAEHLRAALALWEYSERSVLWIFGTSTGNRQADIVLAELRAAYPGCLTRDRIRNLLARNHPVDEVLRILEEQGLVEQDTARAGGRGRPPQIWRANPHPPAIGITAFIGNSRKAENGVEGQ